MTLPVDPAVPAGAEEGDRRSLVLRAAAEAFAADGYQGTGLADICQSAGIAKPTFYHYFPSKAAVLYQLLYDYMDTLLAAAEAQERRRLPPPERLLELMRDMVRSLDTHRGQVRCFYENAVHFLPEPLRERVQARRAAYSQHLDYILLAGRDADLFAFDDVRMTRLGIFGLCGWPYNWYRPGGDVTADDIAQQVWSLVMSGIKA